MEYDIFCSADDGNWCDGSRHYWGILGNTPLGCRGERLAKFPCCHNPNGPWHGYPVSPFVARSWDRTVRSAVPHLAGPEYAEWIRVFGRAPREGDRFRNPDAANAIRTNGIIIVVFAESLGIFSFVIAFLLQGKAL